MYEIDKNIADANFENKIYKLINYSFFLTFL